MSREKKNISVIKGNPHIRNRFKQMETHLIYPGDSFSIAEEEPGQQSACGEGKSKAGFRDYLQPQVSKVR